MNKAPVRNAKNTPTGLLSVSDDTFLREIWITDDEFLLRRALATDAREGFAFSFGQYITPSTSNSLFAASPVGLQIFNKEFFYHFK
jgi:hypothetical protein